MLQEVKDLQNNAVSKLVRVIEERANQTVFTFKAPTGSGKTYMMADFMNRVISENESIIFIVSALSKSKLAEQNYEAFKHFSENGIFSKLNPYLINSDSNGEGSLFIPIDYNVYILPVDLYKETSKLKTEGTFIHFLQDITPNLFNGKQGKTIYLIKDEGHRATNNLDEFWKDLSNPYFSKVINFSATPDLKKKQTPDVEITNEEAESAKLIKQIKKCSEEDSLEVALNEFIKIRTQYDNLLKVHPCMIIQISNKGKAEEEFENIIIPVLSNHPSLKWVYISNEDSSKNDKNSKTNDSGLHKLAVSKWNDYMKDNNSTIDIIIFKMVITEGWDIPRACMLYQLRDSKSKILDEQVMGRVRRNPRLLDFEFLSEDAQKLALTAWIWGLVPKPSDNSIPVNIINNINIEQDIRIKPTRLQDINVTKSFDIDSIIKNMKDNTLVPKSIFEKYKSLMHQNNEIQDLCYKHIYTFNDWRIFTDNISQIKTSFEEYRCDYAKSMIVCDEVSFPRESCFVKSEHSLLLDEWIWCKKDKKNDTDFAFDSDAERQWARILEKLQISVIDEVEPRGNNVNSEKFLWGKNFPLNSEIKFEYYLDGIHASYPDFIMKDKWGRIHIFEVKSLNESSSIAVDANEYEEKIKALIPCYKECANKTGHIFYIPIYNGNEWTIWKFEKEKESKAPLSKDEFLRFIKEEPVSKDEDLYNKKLNNSFLKVAEKEQSFGKQKPGRCGGGD